MNPYPQRTYNLNLGGYDYPIDYERANNFEESENEEGNNIEKTFDIYGEINKIIEKVDKNISETNNKQNMYFQENLENSRRLNQNRFNNYKINNNNFQGSYQPNHNFFHNHNQFKYRSPMRIYKPNFDFINNNNMNKNKIELYRKNNKHHQKNINDKYNTTNGFRNEEEYKMDHYLIN